MMATSGVAAAGAAGDVDDGRAAEQVGASPNTDASDEINASHMGDEVPKPEEAVTTHAVSAVPASAALNKKMMLWRRFKDSSGNLRNFISLPLFVYATSPSTCATSADGVGVAKEAEAAAAAMPAVIQKHDPHERAICGSNTNGVEALVTAIDCLPLSGPAMATSTADGESRAPAVAVVSAGGYQHHITLNAHHQHHMLSHHSPYSNNYPLHHSSSHHHIHSEQTKSLQELQHEVGALLEFRDLVIETFPDLKHKMASMSSSASTATAGNSVPMSTAGASASLASRREWEPGIRVKRKASQKEPSTTNNSSSAASTNSPNASAPNAAGELSSSSLTRSRSNSHSGKKEPKSGENNNGSVVQDSGFSTETSSSKEGHSASSTNGAMTGPINSNRLACLESDDELLNLLDVIHRKSNRLREEVEHLQNYERQNLYGAPPDNLNKTEVSPADKDATNVLTKSSGTGIGELTPQTFREHVERLNKEDMKQLRKERDRLLDKLAEMEAETLTGRIKAAKMSDQVEELIAVKKDLEAQLKLAMAQKLELSSRVQQLQLQQQQQSKSSASSQADYSSQRNFLGTSGLAGTFAEYNTTGTLQHRRQNTFQPVVVVEQQQEDPHLAFHQSASSDNRQQQDPLLGRLDGVVSTPGTRNAKCRTTDSKRFAAILLETSVIELQRHLLTLTVQNQVLMQKLEQASKSKSDLAKRLDKSKEDVEDLRFQLEEKNIELEGTKAQLRVLETRIHASTPSSGAATNSYLLHSQNDYETNRSSASTTLMLSRRLEVPSDCSDMRSGTPAAGQMPPPTNATQISTPSMKAMVHLPMDEVQHHSSSTESAHEQELAPASNQVSRLMSTSVGGLSPFDGQPKVQQTVRKFTAASKPSKIPLPGSKGVSYFGAKPPTGRPSTAGRSPPSANTSTGSNGSSRSSLSRSTGNLLYGKAPHSLKRADSAQSIRKDNNNSSLSTNTSRSSTSSSIPMSTSPYVSGAKQHNSSTSTHPSSKALQNSPLPKLKRDTLTSRVRHLDSLSRVQQHNSSRDASPVTSAGSPATPTSNSCLVSSTPKPSAIAAQFNAALRKELPLNSSSSFSHGSQAFLRRATGNTTSPPSSASSPGVSVNRRFSSASVVGARGLARNQDLHATGETLNSDAGSGSTHGASDSDSGKYLATIGSKSNDAPEAIRIMHAQQPKKLWVQSDWERAAMPTEALIQYAPSSKIMSAKQSITASLEHESAHAVFQNSFKTHHNLPFTGRDNLKKRATEQEKIFMDPLKQPLQATTFTPNWAERSDNLLVTFDYGSTDSLEAHVTDSFRHSFDGSAGQRVVYTIEEERECDLSASNFNDHLTDLALIASNNSLEEAPLWFYASQSDGTQSDDAEIDNQQAFEVHRMQHDMRDSVISLMNSLVEYDVDASLASSGGFAYNAKQDGKAYDYEDEVYYDSMEYTSI